VPQYQMRKAHSTTPGEDPPQVAPRSTPPRRPKKRQWIMRLPRRAQLLLLALCLLTFPATAYAASACVLWEHAFEVWVDGNKDDHRPDSRWTKVATTATQADCKDRSVNEARAEYDALTGQGIRATLAGSTVGFNQRNTRFTRGYRRFECYPDTVDPRG